MTRDFSHINAYLDSLLPDIYEQGLDFGHLRLMKRAMNRWSAYLKESKTILDIGCGMAAIAKYFLKDFDIKYTGITLGYEFSYVSSFVSNILNMDMNFLEFPDNSFDGILARHVLEHSPMPLLTLMEWHRVSKNYLFLVSPNPDSFGYIGRNHYSVMPKPQLRWILRRAGWKIIDFEYVQKEYRFVCEKKTVLGYEGYAEIPLPPAIYASDRDE